MKKVYVSGYRSGRRDTAENGPVHYDGVDQIGTHTLCGHVDQTTFMWEETTRRVNCRGCIAVRDHVRWSRP